MSIDNLFGSDPSAGPDKAFGLPPVREPAPLPADLLLPPAPKKDSSGLAEILSNPGDSSADTALDELALTDKTEDDQTNLFPGI